MASADLSPNQPSAGAEFKKKVMFFPFFFECQKFVLKKNVDTLSVAPGKYVEALI